MEHFTSIFYTVYSCHLFGPKSNQKNLSLRTSRPSLSRSEAFSFEFEMRRQARNFCAGLTTKNDWDLPRTSGAKSLFLTRAAKAASKPKSRKSQPSGCYPPWKILAINNQVSFIKFV